MIRRPGKLTMPIRLVNGILCLISAGIDKCKRLAHCNLTNEAPTGALLRQLRGGVSLAVTSLGGAPRRAPAIGKGKSGDHKESTRTVEGATEQRSPSRFELLRL